MFDLYRKINKDFGDQRESVSTVYDYYFSNCTEMSAAGQSFFSFIKDEKLIERKGQEKHYHSFLIHQMLTRLQEIKFYSKVDITNTRRLVAVSENCISFIQILFRDAIHLDVHFRSSDFDGALPVDLEFISRIPASVIYHLERFDGTPGYEEINPDLIRRFCDMPVKLNLMFGSLHRTN